MAESRVAVAEPIEEAFRRVRSELEIRSGFPAEVLEEAERVATTRLPAASPLHADQTDIPFVTIDPPGSLDLDQAVHVERAEYGYRARYAIADVAFWVDRGGAIEREAWLRGVTFYAPDHREPLYPPVLSAGAASLLPDEVRPTVLFDLRLDQRARLLEWTVERALVRSRAQLTYSQLLRAGAEPDPAVSEAWIETLTLLAELGPKRRALEAERGGTSLPIRAQQVQRRAAETVGYHLVYEQPNEAEGWNAQVSLLAGHVAAIGMLEGGVGLLRTMPTFAQRDVEKFRRIARTLGFEWPERVSYADFIRSLDPSRPLSEVLVRQALRVIRGADYVAFHGTPPEQPLHGALAFTYAHATAPLRRLADRYVLDLLVTLAAGASPPTADEVATLLELPAVMNAADAKTSVLERRVVDVAEAWTLRDRVGDLLTGVVVDVRRDALEVQVEEPPIRAMLPIGAGTAPALGERVEIRVAAVQIETGSVRVELAR